MSLMQKLRMMTYNVRYFSHATRGLASTGRTMDAIALAISASARAEARASGLA